MRSPLACPFLSIGEKGSCQNRASVRKWATIAGHPHDGSAALTEEWKDLFTLARFVYIDPHHISYGRS
jgi:hypothetical protein